MLTKVNWIFTHPSLIGMRGESPITIKYNRR
jgi:hypothetical protein